MATNLQASKARLHQLKAQSTRKEKDIDDLKNQIQTLENEKRSIDVIFEEALTQHAQADSTQLANILYSKLPREIRDIIYSHLYLVETPIPIGSHHFTTYIEPGSNNNGGSQNSEPFVIVPEGAEKIDHSIEPPSNIMLPADRLLDPAYLGQDVGHEASAFYYANNTFTICTLSNAIPTFLLSDHAHNFTSIQAVQPLGLRPIEHIRTLQIRVKYEHHSTNPGLSKGDYVFERRLLQNINANLSPLTSFDADKMKESGKTNIEFILMTAFGTDIETHLAERSRRFVNLLETVRSAIYTQMHDHNAEVKIIHHDEKLYAFPQNLTDVFQLTKSQWEYEKKALEEQAKPYSPLDFYIAPLLSLAPHSYRFTSSNIPAPELYRLMIGRWGVLPNFDTTWRHPITEGMYWPIRKAEQIITG